MARNKNRNGTLGVVFFLIPLISIAAWSKYYSIDTSSLVNLLKMVAPVVVGMYIIGEFLFWGILPRVKPSFRFGFWWGIFILAPYYIFQISYNAALFLRPLPQVTLYPIYLVCGLVSALALGFITWSIWGLLFDAKNAVSPLKMALSRLLILLICLAVLVPTFAKNRNAQPDLVKKRTSYRAFVPRKLERQPSHKMIVLGIDGGDWDVITPLVDDGKMPNIKKLMSEGRWGSLESQTPMRSPSLWTSIFTGQPSKIHGISDWLVSYSKNRLVKAMWNICSEFGLRSIIINIPATFPPEEITGKEISGFPYPNLTLNTYGWILSTKPMTTKLTPFKQLETKMDADGSLNGTIYVRDVLIDKYNRGMRGKIFRNMAIEYVLKTKMGEIYGHDIAVAKFKFKTKDEQIEILPVRGEGAAFGTLGKDGWTDFFLVSLGPGTSSVAKIRVLSMDKDDVTLYMSPFFQPSDNPTYPYTFPKSLAKDITDLFGQYIVEMSWMGAQDDMITFPAIRDLLFYKEEKNVEVGEALYKEQEWDMFIHYFGLTDRVEHPTWGYRSGTIKKESLGSIPNLDQVYDQAAASIDEAYLLYDKWVGAVMATADPSKDIILIVSDHGFKMGTGREAKLGAHRLKGIYLVWGEPVTGVNRSDYKANQSDAKSQLDITPNMLYLMDLPVAEDLPGKLWLDIYSKEYQTAHPLLTIKTYSKEEAEKGTEQKVDQSTLEQIKGLGYLNGANNIEGN